MNATYNAVAYFKPGYKRGKHVSISHQRLAYTLHTAIKKSTANYERRKPKTKGKTRVREQSSQLGRINTPHNTRG